MASARTLQQILTELQPTYAAQTQSLQEQANLIPKQIEVEEQGLNAKKDQAFTDILSGARRRGLGFSGIPLGEQAMYASTEYAPALARLRNAGHERALSLQQAILGINERRDTLGQQIFQQEQDRAFQAEQARLAREASERQAAAARAAAASPTFGSFGGGVQSGASSQQAPKQIIGGYTPKNGKDGSGGFSFKDGRGNAISAYEWSRLNGVNFNDLITRMASSGDAYARAALNSMGGAGAIDRNKYHWLFSSAAPSKAGGGGW